MTPNQAKRMFREWQHIERLVADRPEHEWEYEDDLWWRLVRAVDATGLTGTEWDPRSDAYLEDW